MTESGSGENKRGEGVPSVGNETVDIAAPAWKEKYAKLMEAGKSREALVYLVKNTDDLFKIVEALKENQFDEAVESIWRLVDHINSLISEKEGSEALKSTLESIAKSGDLFKGKSFGGLDPYVQKKIRAKLIAFVEEKARSL